MHEVESMAYNKVEAPWHLSLTGDRSKAVEGDLTPQQFREAAGVDWEVEKIPAFAMVNGTNISVGRSALVRKDTWALLDNVPNDWNPVQNAEAFDFFNDWCAEGSIQMETGGVLRNGQVVWALAKTNNRFEVVRDDIVESYILFANNHRYGWATTVSWSAIRVVCMNTFLASLSGTDSEKIVRVSHRREFVADDVKETLGVSKEKLAKYKEISQFLTSRQATGEDIVTYFKRIFPLTTTKDEKKEELSRNAKTALEVLETQPGADYGRGSWWQPFNAVTWLTDHCIGQNDDNRLYSSWYGRTRKMKMDALNLATEMANAS